MKQRRNITLLLLILLLITVISVEKRIGNSIENASNQPITVFQENVLMPNLNILVDSVENIGERRDNGRQINSFNKVTQSSHFNLQK